MTSQLDRRDLNSHCHGDFTEVTRTASDSESRVSESVAGGAVGPSRSVAATVAAAAGSSDSEPDSEPPTEPVRVGRGHRWHRDGHRDESEPGPRAYAGPAQCRAESRPATRDSDFDSELARHRRRRRPGRASRGLSDCESRCRTRGPPGRDLSESPGPGPVRCPPQTHGPAPAAPAGARTQSRDRAQAGHTGSMPPLSRLSASWLRSAESGTGPAPGGPLAGAPARAPASAAVAAVPGAPHRAP